MLSSTGIVITPNNNEKNLEFSVNNKSIGINFMDIRKMYN